MKTLKVISFNILFLAILLIALELILWQMYPDYQFYYRTHPEQANLSSSYAKIDTNWLAPHPELGWVCQQKEALHFPSPPRRGISYQINPQGFRSAYDFNHPEPKRKKRILLIGDSFTFGIYLAEDSTISHRLQRLKGPEYEFYTLAIPAWGMDQMYLAYLQYAEKIQADQIVLSFIDDDLMRSLEYFYYGCGPKPCFKIEDDSLLINKDNPSYWEYLCWNNQIGNRILRIHYQKKAAELGQYFLKEIIHLEKKAGRTALVVRIPALIDLEKNIPRPSFSMQELMEKEQIPYIELFDSLIAKPVPEIRSFYIPDDGHFNEKGAQLLTECIAPFIE